MVGAGDGAVVVGAGGAVVVVGGTVVLGGVVVLVDGAVVDVGVSVVGVVVSGVVAGAVVAGTVVLVLESSAIAVAGAPSATSATVVATSVRRPFLRNRFVRALRSRVNPRELPWCDELPMSASSERAPPWVPSKKRMGRSHHWLAPGTR